MEKLIEILRRCLTANITFCYYPDDEGDGFTLKVDESHFYKEEDALKFLDENF